MNVKSNVAASPAVENVVSRDAFRLPLGPRLFSLFGVVVVGGTTALMMFMVILAIVFGQWVIGALIVAPLAGFLGYLTLYLANDMRGKWRLRVTFEPDQLFLDLPAGRSLIHHPSAQQVSIAYADIATIESRQEAYRSLGMAMLQRCYMLRRKEGELIFLFEDRAIGTPYETSFFPKVAADIAARAGVALIDLGTAEGDGGVLGLWGAHAPDWAAPSLSAEKARKMWRAARTTGVLSIVAIVIAMLARLLSGTH